MSSEVIHGSVMSSEVIHGSVMSSEVIGSHPRISQVIFPKIDSIDLELFLKLNIFVLKPVGHREICNRYFYLKNRIPRGLDRRCQQNYAVLQEKTASGLTSDGQTTLEIFRGFSQQISSRIYPQSYYTRALLIGRYVENHKEPSTWN